jgi:hypothetical protein
LEKKSRKDKEETEFAHTVFVGNPKENFPLRRHACKQEDIIKTYINTKDLEGVD